MKLLGDCLDKEEVVIDGLESLFEGHTIGN